MYIKEIIFLTKKYQDMIVMTNILEEVVKESGINYGMATVVTQHTTTGITVNEALECLESDIVGLLKRMAPEDYHYSHARMLRDYGSTAGNPTGHLKAHLTGNHCHFPIVNGEIVRGKAQDVYFCEFDGPAQRTVMIAITEC